jgi:hypothetical protein
MGSIVVESRIGRNRAQTITNDRALSRTLTKRPHSATFVKFRGGSRLQIDHDLADTGRPTPLMPKFVPH